MVVSSHIDFGMIAVFGVLVELVVVAVDGVLNVLPFFGLLALVIGLEEIAAVPLVEGAILPPDHADPFPIRGVAGVLLDDQYGLKPDRKWRDIHA